jgi:acyl-CoA synthetase (AMP-forming)/AMP-acid ligase II
VSWQDSMPCAVRRERHFGGRVVRCYADRPAHAHQVLVSAATRAPAAEALVDGGRRIRYVDLLDVVERIAANLACAGVEHGDRIAILLSNSAEFVFAMLAASRLGAPFIPISPRFQPPEVDHLLRHGGARALLYDGELEARLPALDTLPELKAVYRLGPGKATARDFAALLAPAEAPPCDVAEDDAFALLYTSGTTGKPKGALITHLGITHAVMQFEHCWNLAQGERSLLAVPATHATGIGAVIMTMVRVAGCIVVLRAFSARAFLELAQKERLSFSAMAPAMYQLCLMDPDFDRFDLSSWRIGGYGAAPMPTATIDALAQRLPHLQLVNAYGATETTAPPVLMRTSAHPDSVGCVVPCAELMVVDESGREQPRGEPGEIWMHGPTVSPGYWRDEHANAESFSDGWWHSGDIGVVDGDGYVKVLDRKKDMINRAGYKVFSAEVEDVLAGHPAVIECAIVARPDPVLGERVHAFVHARQPAPDLAILRQWAGSRLADYKLPESLTVLGEPLPRNQNGKVAKKRLREWLRT